MTQEDEEKCLEALSKLVGSDGFKEYLVAYHKMFMAYSEENEKIMKVFWAALKEEQEKNDRVL